ncbi:transient receptor potential cation channel subfamily A member 1-like [Tachypleus tridentatus]|uniref:transient receptor potential cation channel subfamily A member 1-like n=1 Tax=Tachypleus tridentatus TaxID=6853 RepID=UPI003FD69DD3
MCKSAYPCSDTGYFMAASKTAYVHPLLAACTKKPFEFENIYNKIPNLLEFQDSSGQHVLHHAASRNNVDIVQFILDHGGDINSRDKNGNTALHLAVANNALETLNCLLSYHADSNVLNKDLKGAIHVATENNKIRLLQGMAKYKKNIDGSLKGKFGRTALHVAAASDFADCARLLIRQLGGQITTPCDNGYCPIHDAVKNGSINTIKVLLEEGELMGITQVEMLTLRDFEGNTALHTAVNMGNIDTLITCLQRGSPINIQQRDLLTPVHLACAEGATEVVRLMFTAKPEDKMLVLCTKDAQQMTPLHYAAIFNHEDLVEYLVKEGADMKAIGKEGRSVLLNAAARGAWKAMTKLLEMGANIHHKDMLSRNLLHHLVLYCGSMEDFFIFYQDYRTELAKLVNEKDVFGCTPTHYASKERKLEIIKILFEFGAQINVNNNKLQSPLHLAAMFGQYHIICYMLQTTKGYIVINDSDSKGMTPLHIASQHGHTHVVKLLLSQGALINYDYKGRTAFHYAAQNGFTNTMDKIFCVHSHVLNQTDREGNTALHLATMYNKANAVKLLLSLNCKISPNAHNMTAIDIMLFYKHSATAVVMVTHKTRWQEIMQYKPIRFHSVVEGLIALMPEVMMVQYDFQVLEDVSNVGPSFMIKERHLPVVNYMIDYSREELLTHPLCVKYLETKWNSYGMYFHLINLFSYIVFLAFITLHAIYFRDTSHRIASQVSEGQDEHVFNDVEQGNSAASCITGTIVLVLAILNIFKEFYQVYQQRVRYFTEPLNLLEWGLYITAGLMSDDYTLLIEHPALRNIVAALAVFLAWFNYLLFLQRFNRVGIYVVMFLEILSTLLKVTLIFSVLIIAFGLSFYILLAKIEGLEEKGFYNPSLSLAKVGTMMLGEVDFIGTFLFPLRHLMVPAWKQLAVAIILLMGFTILMPILLMNLLIGLAVGDIETVRRNAQLKRLTKQVELHTRLEKKLPKSFLSRVDKSEVCEYPNRKVVTSYLWSTLQSCFVIPWRQTGVRRFSSCLQNNSVSYVENLDQQRVMLNKMSRKLDTQQQLLRLIMQKMEIPRDYNDTSDGCSESSISIHYSSPTSLF